MKEYCCRLIQIVLYYDSWLSAVHFDAAYLFGHGIKPAINPIDLIVHIVHGDHERSSHSRLGVALGKQRGPIPVIHIYDLNERVGYVSDNQVP